MKSFFIKIVKLGIFTMMVGILVLNYSLYTATTFDKTGYNIDVVHQLNFIQSKIAKGEAQKMQQQFPEGFVFLHAMYGLAWSDLISNQPDTSVIYRKGLEELTKSVDAIFSPQGKSTFTQKLALEYGAYYRGWSNYLLAQKLIRTQPSARSPEDIQLLNKNCKDILVAMHASESPYLESYHESAWPADMVVGMASVNLAQQITGPRYGEDITFWINKVKAHLDSRGLIPHFTQVNGDVIDGARGSSQALMLGFLYDIDREFALQQYKNYQEHFVDSHLGLKAIREYPLGIDDDGDIDSGPVIWDIGTVATIVGQHTYGKFGDWSRYQATKNAIAAIGFGYTRGEQKKYLFGQLPMADAFLAWSNAVEPMDLGAKVTEHWRWKFQLLSLFVVVGLGWLLWWLSYR